MGKKKDENIVENVVSKITDSFYVIDYKGNIVVDTQQDDIKNLKEFFAGNEEVYVAIIDTVKENGYYSDNIEILVDDKKKNYTVIASDIPSKEHICIIMKDITKSYENLNELSAELAKKEEVLKAKDLFIANLSHEVRTPINIIVGMIYFLKNTNLSEQQLEYVGKLDDASKMLLDMINGILDLSDNKMTSTLAAKSDFNLKKFIDGILEIFDEKFAAKDLKFYPNLDFDHNINVYADKTRLGQVFVNLLENAIKYTDKGFIELDARKIEETNVSYRLQFCVKDTGIGIKREDSLNIFREFLKADDPTTKTREGKGMGLAIAKKIVEDMNGKMWVESSVGLGSKFYFNILVDKSEKQFDMPVASEIHEEEPTVKDEFVPIVNIDAPKKILLVEDNDLNIEITKKIISEMGCICDVAKDGIEAIRTVKENGTRYYDLILMDIHMPKYNGYEISKILKMDVGVNIPIVALTATTITSEVIKNNSEYVTDYIQKPIGPNELKERIQRCLDMKKKEISTVKKDSLLLLSKNENNLREMKAKLSTNFEVTATKSDIEMQILLETDSMSVIVIDEFDDINEEFIIVNDIKCNSKFSKIPLVLINRDSRSLLKQKAFQHNVEHIVEEFELDKCALAITNILNKLRREEKLEGMVEKSKEETENVYNFLFESMVNLTTSKSKETGGHLVRTKEYMKLMLKNYERFYNEKLFTTNEIVEDISMAAVLHDIGKVGIPDIVLNKPGKLNDEEYEIIKSHVIIGRNILESTYGNKVSNDILNYAKDIVYHHHEKYDGSGYPEGLKGEEISVQSRLMALVDVYDALANDRVYKKAMPYDEVEAYIKSQSGKAFDPKVVNVFCLIKDELRKVNEENKDK